MKEDDIINSYKVAKRYKVDLNWKSKKQNKLIENLKKDTAEFAVKELGIENPMNLQVRILGYSNGKLPIARLCSFIKNPNRDCIELNSSTFDCKRNIINYKNVKLVYKHELVHLAFTLQGYPEITDGSNLFEDVLNFYGLTTNEKTEKLIVVSQSIAKQEHLWSTCSCGEKWLFSKSILREYKNVSKKINLLQYTDIANHTSMGHKVNTQIKNDIFKFPTYRYEIDSSKPSFQNVISRLDKEMGSTKNDLL